MVYIFFNMKSNLAKKIIELRKKKGLSQEKLAELAGVTRRTIAYYETDDSKPHIENLKAIASVLKVSVDSLLEINSNVSSHEEIQFDSRTAEKMKTILALPREERFMVYTLAECLQARRKLQELEANKEKK
jgi:transcriptional regulator with XRE-family HTH domain